MRHTTSIPTTRSIKHGLPYNAASSRSSHTMATMTTTLIILGRINWNEMEIYPTLWMWWRMQQTYTTTMTQTMMKVTMTTLMMKTPLLKTKRIPILPTHKWEDGGNGQRLSHRCKSVVVVVVACMSFPQTLVKGCVFLVCVRFFLAFFECWCVGGMSCFVPLAT